MFNAFKYVKILEDMGIPKEQAEAQIHILANIMEENLCSKIDLLQLRNELREEMAGMRTELKEDISALHREIAGVRTQLKENISTLIPQIK